MDAKRRIVILSVGASLCIALALYGAVRHTKIMLSRHGQSVAITMSSRKIILRCRNPKHCINRTLNSYQPIRFQRLLMSIV